MNLFRAMIRCLGLAHKYIHCENGGDYYVERVDNTLKIFFECSDGKEDWLNNFRFFAIPWKPYKEMKQTWLCHRGFLKVWKSIKPHIEADISNPEIQRIEIVGYSHGAAIAVLCHEYCVFNRPDCEVEGVGFGCPRVFWGIVSRSVKERFKNFKVVRNGNDIVTHVPPVIFGFRHISEVVKIGRTSGNIVKDHYGSEYLKNLKGVDL